MKWQVNHFWWGQADVTRPCAEDEWDGKLVINGVKHLYAPGISGPMESEEAKELAERLNGTDAKDV